MRHIGLATLLLQERSDSKGCLSLGTDGSRHTADDMTECGIVRNTVDIAEKLKDCRESPERKRLTRSVLERQSDGTR